ncbi:MAG: histidinol-phosphate aminotransferase family protein [Candidatus Omnitrophica bacterium]|nr:histidinol-phosphate aminotransferase family protein [Candidatus Omnitrophota bacterium]
MKHNFRKHLQNVERKRVGVHPDPGKNILLDRNERVIPYSDKTMRLLCKRISGLRLNLYPDLEVFYDKLSRWLSLNSKEVYITEGVSGAIKSLMETIAEPGKAIVFPNPTFALYPVYAGMFNLKHKTVGYTADYKLDIAEMKKLIGKETSIVFLPNPNVPIEGTISLKEIKSLAGHCARYGVFLVIDEVYHSFGGPTAMRLARSMDNVFVMRSFSKAFGLPGIRLGFVVGAEKNIEYVSKMRTGYETNTLSAETASFFIDNYNLVERYVKSVKEGLAYLKNEFDHLGLEHNGGNASNFIYVDLGSEAILKRVVKALRERHIYVRGGWPAPYASGFCLTAGPKKIMRHFVRELTEILGK